LAFFDFGASARTLPNGRVATSSEERMRFMEPSPSVGGCRIRLLPVKQEMTWAAHEEITVLRKA